MSLRRTTVGILAFLCLGTFAARGAGTRAEIASLAGIPAVGVLVEFLPEDAKKLGMSEDLIRANVEIQLRKLGVPLVHPADVEGKANYVYVHVNTINTTDATVYSVHVGFNQTVLLIRGDNTVKNAGETWRSSWVGICEANNTSRIDKAISSSITLFANDFLKANSPPPREAVAKEELQLGQKGQQADNPAAIWLQLEKEYPGVDVHEEWRKAVEAATAEHGADNPKLRELADKRFREQCKALKKAAGESAASH